MSRPTWNQVNNQGNFAAIGDVIESSNARISSGIRGLGTAWDAELDDQAKEAQAIETEQTAEAQLITDRFNYAMTEAEDEDEVDALMKKYRYAAQESGNPTFDDGDFLSMEKTADTRTDTLTLADANNSVAATERELTREVQQGNFTRYDQLRNMSAEEFQEQHGYATVAEAETKLASQLQTLSSRAKESVNRRLELARENEDWGAQQELLEQYGHLFSQEEFDTEFQAIETGRQNSNAEALRRQALQLEMENTAYLTEFGELLGEATIELQDDIAGYTIAFNEEGEIGLAELTNYDDERANLAEANAALNNYLNNNPGARSRLKELYENAPDPSAMKKLVDQAYINDDIGSAQHTTLSAFTTSLAPTLSATQQEEINDIVNAEAENYRRPEYEAASRQIVFQEQQLEARQQARETVGSVSAVFEQAKDQDADYDDQRDISEFQEFATAPLSDVLAAPMIETLSATLENMGLRKIDGTMTIADLPEIVQQEFFAGVVDLPVGSTLPIPFTDDDYDFKDLAQGLEGAVTRLQWEYETTVALQNNRNQVSQIELQRRGVKRRVRVSATREAMANTDASQYAGTLTQPFAVAPVEEELSSPAETPAPTTSSSPPVTTPAATTPTVTTDTVEAGESEEAAAEVSPTLETKFEGIADVSELTAGELHNQVIYKVRDENDLSTLLEVQEAVESQDSTSAQRVRTEINSRIEDLYEDSVVDEDVLDQDSWVRYSLNPEAIAPRIDEITRQLTNMGPNNVAQQYYTGALSVSEAIASGLTREDLRTIERLMGERRALEKL